MEEVTVNASSSVSLQCPALGNPPPTLSWLQNGLPFSPSPRLQVLEDGHVLQVGTGPPRLKVSPRILGSRGHPQPPGSRQVQPPVATHIQFATEKGPTPTLCHRKSVTQSPRWRDVTGVLLVSLGHLLLLWGSRDRALQQLEGGRGGQGASSSHQSHLPVAPAGVYGRGGRRCQLRVCGPEPGRLCGEGLHPQGPR